jgi:hypothetical protein
LVMVPVMLKKSLPLASGRRSCLPGAGSASGRAGCCWRGAGAASRAGQSATPTIARWKPAQPIASAIHSLAGLRRGRKGGWWSKLDGVRAKLSSAPSSAGCGVGAGGAAAEPAEGQGRQAAGRRFGHRRFRLGRLWAGSACGWRGWGCRVARSTRALPETSCGGTWRSAPCALPPRWRCRERHSECRRRGRR